MIIIEIKNARDVAKREQGRFKVFFASLFGVDIDRRVDAVLAERIGEELRRRAVEAEIRIE